MQFTVIIRFFAGIVNNFYKKALSYNFVISQLRLSAAITQTNEPKKVRSFCLYFIRFA